MPVCSGLKSRSESPTRRENQFPYIPILPHIKAPYKANTTKIQHTLKRPIFARAAFSCGVVSVYSNRCFLRSYRRVDHTRRAARKSMKKDHAARLPLYQIKVTPIYSSTTTKSAQESGGFWLPQEDGRRPAGFSGARNSR